jgi:CheY-like chemotaxis protein
MTRRREPALGDQLLEFVHPGGGNAGRILHGNEVRTAHDGIEAVQAAEQFRPQVILMDVGMPRLNGLDATRRIRELPWAKGVTVIALTGWGQGR